MATYLFSAQAAINQVGELVTSATGQVFDPSDTGFTTPLVVTDVTGAAKTSIVVSGIGQTEIFYVEDRLRVLWRSGSTTSELVSFKGVVDTVEEARDAAADSAADAAVAVSTSLAATAFAADRTYDRERRQVEGSMRFIREMLHSTKRRPTTRSTMTLDREYPDSWTGPVTGSVRLDTALLPTQASTQINAAVTVANPAGYIPDNFRGTVFGATAANGWVRAWLVDPITGVRFDTGVVSQADASGNFGLDLSGVATWRPGYWEIWRHASATSTTLIYPPHTLGSYYSSLYARGYGITDADYISPVGWVGSSGRFYIPSIPSGRKAFEILYGTITLASSETETGAARSYVVEPGQPGYGTNFVLSSYVYDQALALMAAVATNDEDAADALVGGLLLFQRTASNGTIVAGDFIFTGPQHNPAVGDDIVRTGASAVATYALLKYLRAFPQRASAYVRARAALALTALAAKQQTGGVREGLLLGGVGTYTPAIAPKQRRNRATNSGPRTADLTNWAFTLGTGEAKTTSWVSTVGAGPEGRTGFIRHTVTAAKTAGLSGPSYGLISNDYTEAGEAGQWVKIAVWVRFSRALTVQLRGGLRSGPNQTATLTGPAIAVPANTWRQLYVELQAPGTGQFNGYTAEILAPAGTPVALGGTYDMADVLVEFVAEDGAGDDASPYFDGTFVSTPGKLYSWRGLPYLSTSIEDTPGSGQRPNLDYQIDWVSTEHNLDAFWAFDLGEVIFPGSGYLTRSIRVMNGLLGTLWNAAEARFNQGYQTSGPDTADALDLHSWGAIFLVAVGQTEKARAVMTDAALAPFLATVDGVTGYGIADPAKGGYDGLLPNVWSEGTFGVALALRRLGDYERRGQVFRGIDAMQDEDGGWKYVQRVDVSHELTPYRSVAGSAWAVLSVLDEIWTTR